MQPISRTALDYLVSRFDHLQQQPSLPQLEALQDLLEKLDEMAQGSLEPAYFVSSLDPGMGKTLAVSAFLKALLASPEHSSVGVLIGLQRKSEIKDLVSACSLPKPSFAVLTADEEVNALGSSQVNGAQVLFTTQSRLWLNFYRGSFSEASAFFYQGKPRQVRVWDETLMPGRGLCLSRDELLGTLKELRPDFPDQVDRLDELLSSLRTRRDGELVQLQDLQSSFGMDLRTVLKEAHWLASEPRDLLQCLMAISGRTVLVRKPAKSNSHYLVAGLQALPHDFAPAVILDASARIRYGYRLWERRRGGLKRLKEAPKSYKGLTVHYWSKGAGRKHLKQHAALIFDAVARIIADEVSRIPDAKWLVVHRKPKASDANVQEELSRRLPTMVFSHVNFLTWGQHTATNEYSDCTHAMLTRRGDQRHSSLFPPHMFDPWFGGKARFHSDKQIDVTDLKLVREQRPEEVKSRYEVVWTALGIEVLRNLYRLLDMRDRTRPRDWLQCLLPH
jgi:hypothetical protein